MSRILIVEDEPDLAFSLEEDLRRQGHQPVVAVDGEQGLAMATRGEWELVLMDVMLKPVSTKGFRSGRQMAEASSVTAPVRQFFSGMLRRAQNGRSSPVTA